MQCAAEGRAAGNPGKEVILLAGVEGGHELTVGYVDSVRCLGQ